MQRIRILVLVVLLAGGVLFASGSIIFWLMFCEHLPHAHSDVPIISEIGWWPFQDGLVISNLQVSASQKQLYGLTDNHFLLQYRVQGSIKFRQGWKPFISKAQITSRIISEQNESGLQSLSIADVLVVPVIKCRENQNYSGQNIPFDISLEQVVGVMEWGTNRYDVRCGDKKGTVTVERYK